MPQRSPASRELLWRAIGPVLMVRTWAISAYLLFSVLVGGFWYAVLASAISLGVGMALLWVGVLLLAVLPFVWRWGARLERRVVGVVFGQNIQAPYRSTSGKGSLLRRVRIVLVDPATWKDLAYLVLLCPLGALWSAITITVWGHALTLAASPLYFYALPHRQIGWLGFGMLDLTLNAWWKVVAAAVVGLLLTVPAAWIVRGIGEIHRLLARALLGSSRAQAMAAEAVRLRTSRDAAVDAAAAERRRIERDLHDGAQQRLIALAMDLGMAKSKFATDPAAVEALITHAHAEAKHAIAELRDLARGLHPAMLTERGLDASLSALAGRSPVPVEITVTVPRRPPLPAETTVYFVAAEALANTAKHANATRAWVRIYSDAARQSVRVDVGDDGVGGARVESDGGLAGLGARVGAAGGTLTVSSPPGGPTLISAEVPCVS